MVLDPDYFNQFVVKQCSYVKYVRKKRIFIIKNNEFMQKIGCGNRKSPVNSVIPYIR